MKKRDAIGILLSEGVEDNNQGVAMLKERFGLDCRPGQYASYKWQLKNLMPEDSLAKLVATVEKVVQLHGVEKVKKVLALFEEEK